MLPKTYPCIIRNANAITASKNHDKHGDDFRSEKSEQENGQVDQVDTDFPRLIQTISVRPLSVNKDTQSFVKIKPMFQPNQYVVAQDSISKLWTRHFVVIRRSLNGRTYRLRDVQSGHITYRNGNKLKPTSG